MLDGIKRTARAVVKSSFYHLGPLRAYHRARNRRVLTVVIFHRVLDQTDPRFAYCDPEYTMPAQLFAACLDFFAAHYRPVSLTDVLAAQLPDYPLLITLDDGWADHQQVALPLLANRRMPALAFIAGDAIEGRRPLAFWETLLIHGFRAGTLSGEDLARLWDPVGEPRRPVVDLPSLRRLIRALETLADERLRAALAPFEPRLAPGGHRHFLSGAELAGLQRNGVALGGHGACHAPMARLADPAADLRLAQQQLQEATGQPATAMSFPHGSYTTAITAAAREAGYRVLFTGDPVLNQIGDHGVAPTLGRIELPTEAVSDASGAFRPELLALRLFRGRHAQVSGER
jgi:peptidoglycan/xylan/chitin deacetylase (PgdA/CDA1 family)